MKGVILTGGTGSRLLPLTKVTNKCLLPVGREPMICHCIKLLTGAGIDDIMLITGPEHMGHIISLLGSGAEFGCSLSYRVQDKADGIAAALKLCRTFVGNDRCAVLLGDNIFEDTQSLSEEIKKFSETKDAYKLFTKRVHDPQRFGVAVFDKEKIVDIVEKPKQKISDHAVVGLYCYSHEVFDIIDTLVPSARGEYEISDVNSHMVKNKEGSSYEIQSSWIDAGTHESYMRANELMWRTK